MQFFGMRVLFTENDLFLSKLLEAQRDGKNMVASLILAMKYG